MAPSADAQSADVDGGKQINLASQVLLGWKLVRLGSGGLIRWPSSRNMNTAVPSKDNDCYFFYYSSCTKGGACPFRHEPLALTSEVVCNFWKQGQCTKARCIYRHMDIAKKRSTIPCYWESQPGGCKKPHCPFLHDAPKDPYPDEISDLMEKPSKNIIVNKNKIAELSAMILPVQPQSGEEVSAREVLHSASRLSVRGRLGPARSGIKARLGYPVGDDDLENLEVFEVDEDEALNPEEDELRRSAIQTLDLRSRLADKTITRTVRNVDPASSEDEEAKAVKSMVVVKKVKRAISEKKDEKMKRRLMKKQAKKVKKDEKKKRKSKESPRKSKRKPLKDDLASSSSHGEDDEPAKENEAETQPKKRRAPSSGPSDSEATQPKSLRRSRSPIARSHKRSTRSKRDDKALYNLGRAKAKAVKLPSTTQADINEEVDDNSLLDDITNESIDVIKEIDDLLSNS